MEDEGLLVLSQAQMDLMGNMESMGQEGVGMTFASDELPSVSEPHNNGATETVDLKPITQVADRETRVTTSLKARKRTKTGCLSKPWPIEEMDPVFPC